MLYGFRPASRGTSADARIKLVARGRNGRRLAFAGLVRWGGRRPYPHAATLRSVHEHAGEHDLHGATLAFKTKNAASTSCSLDGAPFVSCSSPVSFTALALGKHALTVLATNQQRCDRGRELDRPRSAAAAAGLLPRRRPGRSPPRP